MSKSSVFQSKAFQSVVTSLAPLLVSETSNLVFNVQPLDETESMAIEKLLAENVQSDGITEDQVSEDAEQLKRITSEIKAIGKQGTVLMGERVQRARELLKPYKDGTFTKWLASTFGTRKTGYNMLAYYELYNALPDDLRDRLKRLPQRTAYILASRDGDIGVKAEIISEHYSRGHDELVARIQERLPLASEDRRTKKSSSDRLLTVIRESVQKLQSEKKMLTEANRAEISRIKELIDALLTDV